MYTETNYKTKKALQEAFASGKAIGVYQPGGFFEGKTDGKIALEGPHYPKPHMWYVGAVIKDSVIVLLDGKTAEQYKVKFDKAAAKKALA